jgi:hypothetical protein
MKNSTNQAKVLKAVMDRYGLIQQKKSKLPANSRAWVVRQFERNYKLIK